MADVVLHIGLHKTGTTSIQHALTSSAALLDEHGVSQVGSSRRDVVWGVDDLLGRRFNKDDTAGHSGAWQRVVDELDASSAATVVLSEELLSLARPRQVRQLARSLHRHQLHVVLGLRDLARSLPSAWQQEIVQGRTYTWGEFTASIRGEAAAPASAGVAFWLRFDALRVLDAWEQVVPRERIHLITVPPPGTPHEVLLDRFAEVLGVPDGVLRDDNPERNRSLGAVEVEVLRRFNGRQHLSAGQYSLLVNTGIRPALLRGSTRPLRLPADLLGWVEEQTASLVDELRARGYAVHGDLADLTPVLRVDDRRLDDVTEAELLTATEGCLVGLAGANLRSHRRLERSLPDDHTRAPAEAHGRPPLSPAAQQVRDRLAEGLARSEMPRPRQRRCLQLAELAFAEHLPQNSLGAVGHVTASARLAATEQAVDALSAAYLDVRSREAVDEDAELDVPWRRRLASSARATSFGLRVSALEKADRSATLGYLARAYRKRLER